MSCIAIMDEEYLSITEPDSHESIMKIPIFSYFIIIGEQGNYLFSSSFEFKSNETCETFFSKFKFEDKDSLNRLKFISEILNRLLTRRLLINQQKESNYIEFSENPFFICLFHYHKLNFITVYSEIDSKFTENQKDFIKGSLQGIASTYIALHTTNELQLQPMTPESENVFLNAIPVILCQQNLISRNCSACSTDKICLPKILEKKIRATQLT